MLSPEDLGSEDVYAHSNIYAAFSSTKGILKEKEKNLFNHIL